MSTSRSDIPAAIAETIFSFLPDNEIKGAARTCTLFAQAAKSNLKHRASKKTLAALKEIALHPDISGKEITEGSELLRIKQIRFPSQEDVEAGEEILRLPRSVTIDRSKAYTEHVLNQMAKPLQIYLENFAKTWDGKYTSFFPKPIALCLKLFAFNTTLFNQATNSILSSLQIKLSNIFLNLVESKEESSASLEMTNRMVELIRMGVPIKEGGYRGNSHRHRGYDWEIPPEVRGTLSTLVLTDTDRNFAVAAALLERGVSVYAAQFQCAMHSNSVRMFTLLLKYQNNATPCERPDRIAVNLMTIAIRHEAFDSLDAFFRLVTKDYLNSPEFRREVLDCTMAAFEFLLKQGLEIHNENGCSLLIFFADQFNEGRHVLEKMKLLIQCGANVHQVFQGKTALKFLEEHQKTAKCKLTSGLFSSKKTREGQIYFGAKNLLENAMKMRLVSKDEGMPSSGIAKVDTTLLSSESDSKLTPVKLKT